MRKRIRQNLRIAITMVFIAAIIGGCGSQEDKTLTSAKPVIAPGPVIAEAPAASSESGPPASPTAQINKDNGSSGVAIEVNGEKLMKNQLDADIQKKLALIRDQLPSDKLDEARSEIRRGLVDEFVLRALLTREMNRKKVSAGEKDIEEVMEGMKAQLPAGMTIEELLKRNKIDAATMREEIGMNIGINKLVTEELGGKAKVAEKEIGDFYKKNQDKFKQPEQVHARHILVAKASGDTDKIKADKKAKAEELRRQLVAGADFADVAAKNSDCPSKQNGGDLGSFVRGQMVKPFEDAAFSQAVKVIGPTVETDFGFHIIQVLEHRSAQIAKLDGETKKQITVFLERQRQQEAFDGIVKRLKAEANIVVYGK